MTEGFVEYKRLPDNIYGIEHVISVPKGTRMPDTATNWKTLAELYGNTIERQRDEISLLKRKINKLEQRK